MTKVRNQYSAEFKLELIKLIEEQGQKVPDVAGQYRNTISTAKTNVCSMNVLSVLCALILIAAVLHMCRLCCNLRN